MTSIITPSSVAEFRAATNASGSKPDFVRTTAVTSGVLDLDTYTLGVRFHAFLTRIKDHEPLRKDEKLLLPYLNVLRDQLRSFGVVYLNPEVKLSGKSGLPNARCDLLLKGGLAKIGVAEVKVTNVLPEVPHDSHVMQLAVYEELVAQNRHVETLWGCVAYVSFRERRVRMFAYRDVTALRLAATDLLAA